MRLRLSAIPALVLGAAAACTGSDPAPFVSPGDAGAEAAPAPPTPAPRGPEDASPDAAVGDAEVEAGPSCATESTPCLDALVAQIKTSCNPARFSCVADCGADGACKERCIGVWVTCQIAYEKECVTCATTAQVCAPTEYCHEGVAY